MSEQSSWRIQKAAVRYVACFASFAVLNAGAESPSQSISLSDWPGWRGPSGDGLSQETNIPTTISPEVVRWKTPLAGAGHASPIVFGDNVIIVAVDESSKENDDPKRPGTERARVADPQAKVARWLTCLDRKTGKENWRRTVLSAPLEKIHSLNSRASSTPAVDGERIYVSFLDGAQMFVAAYDVHGQKVWEARPGPFASMHGFCTNPVVYKDRLIVNGDHDGEAFIAILDKHTGRTVRTIPRANKLRSYCTPIIARIDGKDQFLLSGGKTTAGYDAETGEQVWTCDGPSEQMVATLLRGHGLIFSLGGFPERHLLAIREGGRGTLTSADVAWRSSRAIPYVPSALLYGDLLHVVSDEGVYTSFDAKTGKIHAQERLCKHVSASLVGAENHVYVFDDRGEMTVLDNKPGKKVLARSMLGEAVFASPAVAKGAMFVRGEKHLYCIGHRLKD